MFERFSRPARAAVTAAQRTAAAEGATTVEAEHFLLALSVDASARTTHALQALGVTEAAVRAALDKERTHALQLVGVANTAAQRKPLPPKATPRFGQSAKLALERSLEVALDRGDRSIDDHHILLALGRAEAGVIPGVLRALDITSSALDAELG